MSNQTPASNLTSRWNAAAGCWMFWDPVAGLWYHYDSRSDRLIYADRSQRPRTLPRESYTLDAPQYGQSPPSEPSYLTGRAPINDTSRANLPTQQRPGLDQPRSTYGNVPQGGQAQVPRTPYQNQNQSGQRQLPGRSDPRDVPTSSQSRADMPRMADRNPSSPPQGNIPVLGNTGHGTQLPYRQSGAPQPGRSQAQVTEQSQPREFLAIDRRTGKRTFIRPELGEIARLFPDYYVRRPRDHFFRVGRVFKILWAEPAGEIFTAAATSRFDDSDPSLVPGRYEGQQIYSNVRRFVVVREFEGFCHAIPIVTYGKQGVGKAGTKKSEYTIVHTSREAPQPLSTEKPRDKEEPMRSRPIRIVPDVPAEVLDPFSRLHLAGVRTIQHNLKVKAIGMVHESSVSPLLSQLRNVENEANFNARGGRPSSTSGESDQDSDEEGNEASRRSNRQSKKYRGKLPSKDAKSSGSKGKEPVRDSKREKQTGRSDSRTQQAAARPPQAPINSSTAMWARNNANHLIKQRGMNMDQAVNELARRLQVATPGKTLDAAVREVQSLLAQSNTIMAQQSTQTSGPSRFRRREDDDESSGESSDE